MKEDPAVVFSPPPPGERLAGLSPPPKGKLLSLTAAEFLKHFSCDGSAAVDCKRQIKFKLSVPGRSDALEDRLAPWPECLHSKAYDVYYSCPSQDPVETTSDRLKSRLHRHDTSSTCISRTLNSAATVIKLNTSPGNKLRHHSSPGNKHSHSNKHHSSPGNKLSTVTSRKLNTSPGHRCSRKRKREEDDNLTSTLREPELSVVDNNQNLSKDTTTSQVSIKSKLRVTAKNTSSQDAREANESRSLRHKRKLEYVVKTTLKDHGIAKTDPVYRPSAMCLFNLTKEHLKDLRSYQSLRLEMERIAQSNVDMIVKFERERQAKSQENVEVT